MGDWLARGRPQIHSSRSSELWRISKRCKRRLPSAAWNSLWILHFNARRTTHTSKNTRNGFASGRMAPFNTRKTRLKNTRIFIRSISKTSIRRALCEELKSVVLYWIEQGIRIFRVDNPHTKPFDFWEWLIEEVQRDHPEAIFLAEAFTRPKVMYRLAKLGFTQSYTYFAWKNTKWELTEYFTELYAAAGQRVFSRQSVAEYARHSERIFAARRTAGIHGPADPGGHPGRKLWDLWPAFELCENRAVKARQRRVFGLRKISDSSRGPSNTPIACAA